MLVLDLRRERLIDFPVTGIIRVVPESVMTVAVVSPSGMIDDRVKADPVDIDTAGSRHRRLLADISEPIGSLVVF